MIRIIDLIISLSFYIDVSQCVSVAGDMGPIKNARRFEIPWDRDRRSSSKDTVYTDPGRFNPDRFLDHSVPNAPAFGFGRR